MLGPVLSAILVTVALAGCALLKRRHRSAAHSPSHAIPAPPPGNVVEPEAQGAIISPFATRASRPSRTSHELNDVFNRNTLPAAHSSVSGIQSSLSGLPPTWVSGASNKQHSGNLNQASEADRASQLPGHGSSRFTRSPSQGTTRSASMQHAPPPDVLEALLAVNKDCVEGGSGLIAWPRNQSPQNADAAGGTEEAPNRGHTVSAGLGLAGHAVGIARAPYPSPLCTRPPRPPIHTLTTWPSAVHHGEGPAFVTTATLPRRLTNTPITCLPSCSGSRA